jgi:hypothetical protein
MLSEGGEPVDIGEDHRHRRAAFLREPNRDRRPRRRRDRVHVVFRQHIVHDPGRTVTHGGRIQPHDHRRQQADQ